MGHPAWWDKVVARVRAYQTAKPANLPGATFAIETSRDGRMTGAVGEHWADDTICAIASLGKPFVATALLLALEERDLLDIERPVCELPGMELYGGDEAKRQIKVRHLLQHTSGLPTPRAIGDGLASCRDPRLDLGPSAPWVGSPGMTNECIQVGEQRRPARTLSLDQVSQYVMETFSPIHRPGTKYLYSNVGYIVAGRLIEQLSGESMNRYVKRRLLEPLGMKDAFFVAQESGDERVDRWQGEGVTQEQRQRVPEVALITQDGEMPPEIAAGPDGKWDRLRQGWRYVFPEGGMYATAGDLLNYLGMLRDGGKREGREVVSKQVVDLLVEDQGFRTTLGFGFVDESKRYGPSAKTLMHLGRFNSFGWIDQRENGTVVGVFLSQRLTSLYKNPNMRTGTQVIFNEFIPALEAEVFPDQMAKRV